MKKVIAALISALLILALVPVQVSAFDTVTISGNEDTVISGSGSVYDISGFTGNIMLEDAVIKGEGRSAVFVKDNSDVNFILKGTTEIEGDENNFSCGIEVEIGSTVRFSGDGTLYVKGGKYGAGIGSYGTTTNIPEEERVNVGKIYINSGTVIATAGARGSGIGSGYHVNGNYIEINGGTVYAYGRECGAGIGTGYGTSGGAIGVAAVGEYDCGTIIINGGTVRAYAGNNDSFVKNADKAAEMLKNMEFGDTDEIIAELNANDPGSFAAGIGGGYGSSASRIEINGGDVLAVGSCGGAGIGAGRGTSKASQYNKDEYKANIKIGGNAKVIAITATSRSNEINGGGAAIGTGRGSHTGGNIEISGQANVIAFSATKSPAIGPSAQKSPVDGTIPHAESITVGSDVTLYAASYGDYAVDKDAVNLSIDPKYFGSSDRWFFGEDHKNIEDKNNVAVQSPEGEREYKVPSNTVSLWSNIVSAPAQPGNGQSSIEGKGDIIVILPLAMAIRTADGSVYYHGDVISDIEYDTPYQFRMCTVDWSTRRETKVHEPYEVYTPGHGDYEGDGAENETKGFSYNGSVVYSFILSSKRPVSEDIQNEFNAETKTLTIYTYSVYKTKGYTDMYTPVDENGEKIPSYGDALMLLDNNNFFMAYRFYFISENYAEKIANAEVNAAEMVSLINGETEKTMSLAEIEEIGINFMKGTGIDKVVEPTESLSINLPLGATVKVKAYSDVLNDNLKEALIKAKESGNYEDEIPESPSYIKDSETPLFVRTDEIFTEESWTTRFWKVTTDENGAIRTELLKAN
ncbi:MAG: hypothetical protein IJT49_02245 [Clostridia bacterium]|nr:hypothetical protein [Clostridia bacterium]